MRPIERAAKALRVGSETLELVMLWSMLAAVMGGWAAVLGLAGGAVIGGVGAVVFVSLGALIILI